MVGWQNHGEGEHNVSVSPSAQENRELSAAHDSGQAGAASAVVPEGSHELKVAAGAEEEATLARQPVESADNPPISESREDATAGTQDDSLDDDRQDHESMTQQAPPAFPSPFHSPGKGGPEYLQSVGIAVDSEFNALKLVHHHHGDLIDSTDIGFDAVHDPDGGLFERPKEFDKVRQRVQNGDLPVVVLAVPEGGRSTTALALVKSCKPLEPRRIGPRSGPKVTANQLATYPGSAWLMDLTDPDEELTWEDTLEHLAGLKEHVRAQKSVLIVIANKDDLASPQIQRRGIVEEFSRPDAFGVFERMLPTTLARVELAGTTKTVPAWKSFFEARKQLENEPPGVALRLCTAVTDAERYWAALNKSERDKLKDTLEENQRLTKSVDDTPYVEQLALDRFQTWEDELDQWNGRYENEPRLKAFQVAAAMLPSGDPVRVRDAASDLLKSIDPTESEQQGLRGPGTRLLVRKSMAVLKDGRISFPRPGFNEAVVRYFWDDWPEYRSQFLSWMMALATDNNIDLADRKALKKRISDFAIHHAQQRGEFDFLRAVITKWAEVKSTLGDAVQLLERAATASGIFSKVRRHTLDWLSQDNVTRKRVVAELCASVTFAPFHPRLIMKRLSHLMTDNANHEYAIVPRETLLKSCRLLIAESGQTQKVLEWLDANMTAGESGQQHTTHMFLELAMITPDNGTMPIVLSESTQSNEIRSTAVSNWASALRNVVKVGEATATFHMWMECCTEPSITDEVLSMFRDALEATHVEAYKAAQLVDKLERDWYKESRLLEKLRDDIDGRLNRITRDLRERTDTPSVEAPNEGTSA